MIKKRKGDTPNEHNVSVSSPKERAGTLIVEGPSATKKKKKLRSLVYIIQST